MLLRNYRLEIFNNKCMPGAMTVQCIALLNQDVSKALPYVNSELGGFEYIKKPPSVTFKMHGKLVSVHGCKIAINTVKDGAEARKIVDWLKRVINDVWERRDNIEPRFEGMPRPKLIEILKKLPKTNCRKCGEPTCMVFAVRLTEGAKDSNNCPELTPLDKAALDSYMINYDIDEGATPW